MNRLLSHGMDCSKHRSAYTLRLPGKSFASGRFTEMAGSIHEKLSGINPSEAAMTLVLQSEKMNLAPCFRIPKNMRSHVRALPAYISHRAR
jgi:hypothetical protein